LQISRDLQAKRLETKQHVRLIGIYLPGRFFFCRTQRYDSVTDKSPGIMVERGQSSRGKFQKIGAQSVSSANRQLSRRRWLPSRRSEQTLYGYEISMIRMVDPEILCGPA
jgi:hypothetical protein